MILVQFWENFIIVTWQKQLFQSVLRFRFLFSRIGFWHTEKKVKGICFAYIFPKLWLCQKSDIWLEKLNRYFCHVTIIKWFQTFIITIRKCFFGGYLFVRLLKSPLKVDVNFLAANTNIYTEKDSIQCNASIYSY